MTWYALPTTTATIRIDGERLRGELAVTRQLQCMDIVADAALEARFVRKGNDRNFELTYAPLLPGYVFAEMNEEQHAKGIRVDGALGRSLKIIKSRKPESRACMEAQAVKFLAALAKDRAEAERIALSRDKAAMCAYKPGEVLDIIEGAFIEMLAHFRGLTQKPGDQYPMIEADIDMMGRKTPVRLDPLSVRKAS